MSAKEDASKTAKLAAALKDNLKRRKAQARARGGSRLPRQDAGVAPHHDEGGVQRLEDQPRKGPNAAKKTS